MNTPASARSGEPRLAAIASWAVLAASFGLSAATWIAMARLAGFGAKVSLPAADVTADLAWLMPVAVDGYVVVALVLWMAPVPPRVAAFAKVNTYAAAGVGIVAQSAYHAFAVWSAQPAGDREVWRAILAAVVGAIPPAVAALAVHMRALIRRETQPTHQPAPVPAVQVEQPPAAAPVEQPAGLVVPKAQPEPVTVEQPPAPVKPLVELVEPLTLSLLNAPPATPARPSADGPSITRHNGIPLTGQVTR